MMMPVKSHSVEKIIFLSTLHDEDDAKKNYGSHYWPGDSSLTRMICELGREQWRKKFRFHFSSSERSEEARQHDDAAFYC